MSQLLLSALADGCNMLGLQSDSSREPAVEFCAGALGVVLGPRLHPISQDPKDFNELLNRHYSIPFWLRLAGLGSVIRN